LPSTRLPQNLDRLDEPPQMKPFALIGHPAYETATRFQPLEYRGHKLLLEDKFSFIVVRAPRSQRKMAAKIVAYLKNEGYRPRNHSTEPSFEISFHTDSHLTDLENA
jgi:hypothetical protein